MDNKWIWFSHTLWYLWLSSRSHSTRSMSALADPDLLYYGFESTGQRHTDQAILLFQWLPIAVPMKARLLPMTHKALRNVALPLGYPHSHPAPPCPSLLSPGHSLPRLLFLGCLPLHSSAAWPLPAIPFQLSSERTSLTPQTEQAPFPSYYHFITCRVLIPQ